MSCREWEEGDGEDTPNAGIVEGVCPRVGSKGELAGVVSVACVLSIGTWWVEVAVVGARIRGPGELSQARVVASKSREPPPTKGYTISWKSTCWEIYSLPVTSER